MTFQFTPQSWVIGVFKGRGAWFICPLPMVVIRVRSAKAGKGE